MTDETMPLYSGTKQLRALPMTKADYCAYRRWDVPADENPLEPGYLVEYVDGGKPNLPELGHTGYVSWSPADVFERTYRPCDGKFGFGEAIAKLKAGAAVSRLGWNGNRMFLYYVPEGAYPARTDIAKAAFGDEGLVPYRAYIAMKTAQGDVVPWVASQSDVLENDWIEVGLIRPV